jgi:hypothetical protein
MNGCGKKKNKNKTLVFMRCELIHNYHLFPLLHHRIGVVRRRNIGEVLLGRARDFSERLARRIPRAAARSACDVNENDCDHDANNECKEEGKRE